MKAYDASIRRIARFDEITRRFRFVYQVGIEDVELVALNNFRWRIVVVLVTKRDFSLNESGQRERAYVM